jgi:hypothetical protein
MSHHLYNILSVKATIQQNNASAMEGEDIKGSLFSALTEFFSTIEKEKARCYRPFKDEACDMLIKSSFPSLANLMKVEERHLRRLLLFV